ncbi:MAG: TolC family protein [Phycisphaerae bacterium]|nr:TolC family protein [Phycisphaerae bacterium]
MRHWHSILRGLFQTVLVAACALGVHGCASPEDVKAKVDRDVYRSIDRHWKEEFGPKANYRVSDVEPSSEDVRADQALPCQLGTLTLAQAVALATGRNRDYQAQRELLYTSALNLRLTRHQFERQFFGLGSASYREAGDDEAISAEASTGFNRLLADGTLVSLNLASAWVDVLSGTGVGGLASVLSASAVKPLMRGSGRDVVMEVLTQADRDLLYEVRTFNHFRKALVVSVISDYYATLVFQAYVRNARANQQAIADLLQLALSLVEGARIPTYEVDRIRQELLQAEQETVEAQRDYEEFLDLFKLKLGVPPSLEFTLDRSALASLDASPLAPLNATEKEALDTALARRLDLANTADRVVDAQRKVSVAKDRLRADLNLLTSTRNVSGEQEIGTQTLVVTDKEYSVGLQAGLPLDRLLEENEYRAALLTVGQQRRQYDLTADTIAAEVRMSYRKAREAAERYRISKEGLALAQERVRNTLLLLRNGRANTRRVLDAQEALCNAQNESIDALADYATATLEFYRDTGVLQVRPDGMWEL